VRPWRPAQLVDRIARTAAGWKPGAVFFNVAGRLAVEGVGGGANYARWEREQLIDGDPWYVRSDMCALLVVAAAQLPGDTMLNDQLVGPIRPRLAPTRRATDDECGYWVATDGPPTLPIVVWFEEPLWGIDSATGARTVRVDCLVVGPSLMPDPLDVIDVARGPAGYMPVIRANEGTLIAAVTISSYQWIDDADRLVPLGRSTWLTDTTIDGADPVMAVMGEAYSASSAEDRRWLAALIALARTPRLIEASMVGPDRHERRRAQREGRPAPPPVRVVGLRSVVHAGPEGSTELAEERARREYTCRWMVKGHWRNVAYGPGRTLHRPTWIAPFVSGPEDKPLRIRPTVRVLEGEV
jgi:hypothetical protein